MGASGLAGDVAWGPHPARPGGGEKNGRKVRAGRKGLCDGGLEVYRNGWWLAVEIGRGVVVALGESLGERRSIRIEKGTPLMDEKTFQDKLAELLGEISSLPRNEREALESLANQTQQRHQQLKKTVRDLQESLDYLRLSIKYLLFDLEATRRENQYLRKMIEEEGQTGEDRSE